MICRLCLENVQCIINIFDELGVELNVAEIVAKHFWFEPKPDDPISNSICEACWHKVTDFNDFYSSVEEAHRLLNERFSFNCVKPNKTRKISTNVKTKDENAVSTTTLQQNTVDSNESIENFDNAASTANEVTIEVEEVNDIAVDVTDSNDFVDHDEISTYLTLSEINELDQDALEETSTPPTIERNKRITRANSKETKTTSMAISPKKKLKLLQSTVPDSISPTRRRGRPKKDTTITPATPAKSLKSITKHFIKNEAKALEKLSAKTQEEAAISYKEKIRQGNERIAQFLSLSCDICNEYQETFALLSKHMSTKHRQRGYVICCNKKIYKRVSLLDHVERHLNPELFSCKECDKTFADKQCLQNHMTIKHLPEESKTFACEFCHKKFGRTYLLEQHQRSHKERNHICDICQKGFPSVNQLKAHIKVIHNNYGTMCEICSKVIRGRSAFSRHMLQHEGVDLPKVQCPECGSWHKDKYCLQKHIRRHNIDGTKHICNECGKIAPNRSALLSHKRYVHKAERAYECGLCKKAFKSQISLREHMATHTGEALYKCPYCSRTFNSNANMHSHRKKMHPKEFAEARMQRQKLALTEKNLEIEAQQTKDEQDEEEMATQQQQPQQQDLTIDSSNIINLDDDETHILMTTDKFGELVFKVEQI